MSPEHTPMFTSSVVTRRSVTAGAAWAVPVLAVAAAAPRVAASGATGLLILDPLAFTIGWTRRVVYTLTLDPQNPDPATADAYALPAGTTLTWYVTTGSVAVDLTSLTVKTPCDSIALTDLSLAAGSTAGTETYTLPCDLPPWTYPTLSFYLGGLGTISGLGISVIIVIPGYEPATFCLLGTDCATI